VDVKYFLAAILACASLFITTACEELDESFDCAHICQRLKECVDDDLNTQRCTDRCFDTVDDRRALRHEADDCSACIDDHSCREIPDDCSVCDDVLREFTSRQFDEP
jgi:hypothetical protein